MRRPFKKVRILSVPYIIAGMLATNFGEAWRITEGMSASEKMQGIIMNIGPAFADPLPSLYPADIIIGIIDRKSVV